jgi:predicted DNA-binding transcriptional regulator AlpA
MTKYLRFHDLVALGILTNRMTLKRWIDDQGFPRPIKLGHSTAVYPADAVEAWIAQRAQREPKAA